MDSNINLKNLKELTVVIDQSCNMNCNYCDQIHSTKKLDPKDFISFLDQIKFKEIDHDIVIEIFGGEPIQKGNEVILKEILKYFKENLTEEQLKLLHFKINTNAMYVSNEFDKMFRFMNINCNLKLLISYDMNSQKNRLPNLDDKTLKIKNRNIINNINHYFDMCFNSKVNISFMVDTFNMNKNSVYSILININELKYNFPITNDKIYFYFIREPWKLDIDKIPFIEKALETIYKMNILEYSRNPKTGFLNYIQNFINTYNGEKGKLGCGMGYTRFTFLPDNKISPCSLDNNFDVEEKIEHKAIIDNCIKCEIFDYCDKICPKKIFYRDKSNLNSICELKKMEHKLFNKYKDVIDKVNQKLNIESENKKIKTKD